MYSAVRIFQNLPSRGQRTKTNAKTAKSRRTLRLITSSSSTSKKTNTVNKPMKQPKNKVLNKKQKKK
jgi:ribosomal protein S13